MAIHLLPAKQHFHGKEPKLKHVISAIKMEINPFA
jgi:hypothetical protein